ncbi:MAG: hypothetical protein Q7U38_16485 [Methylobacter sp.]|nr:hypothetical protein [Methylobacter sp.]MDP2099998.1 hypothetical protein [Methylobacter sp.]MDP2427556.1 hypothetical protein [Methylobacter sp.]MDP3054514.1 hypothetical protein [Methylobacter sp.]MDP3362628.1 hypothetical protein [Methylobacter sp.]
MKSQSDFKDQDNYRDYLRSYYAGQILQGLVVAADNNLFTRQIMAEKVDKAVYLADRLIRTLGSNDET